MQIELNQQAVHDGGQHAQPGHHHQHRHELGFVARRERVQKVRQAATQHPSPRKGGQQDQTCYREKQCEGCKHPFIVAADIIAVTDNFGLTP